MSMLFELPAGAERPLQLETLSAGGRRRVRQAQAVLAGVHPLALAITGIRMHPDADRTAHAGDRPTLPLRCGSCWHRRDTHWGYPKCWYGGDSRVTHGDATTVRAWWPACADYSNGGPALRCAVCGKPTDTPPECGDCFAAEDARAVRRSDR